METPSLKQNLKEFTDVLEQGYSKFHIYCREGFIEEISSLLDDAKTEGSIQELVNHEDKEGRTGLFYAIDGTENGFPKVVGRVLNRFADQKRCIHGTSR